MHQTRLTPETLQKIADHVAAGGTAWSISQTFHVSKKTAIKYRNLFETYPLVVPTADQVAHVAVVVSRELAFPIELMTEALARGRNNGGADQARGYMTLALRRLIPECPGITIGRMVGSTNPGPYVGIIESYFAKGKLRWYRPDTLDRIMAGARSAFSGRATNLPVYGENAQAPAAGPAAPIPAATSPRAPAERPRSVTAPSHFDGQTYTHGDFNVPPSKRALRDELKQAVQNTAKMPSQN